MKLPPILGHLKAEQHADARALKALGSWEKKCRRNASTHELFGSCPRETKGGRERERAIDGFTSSINRGRSRSSPWNHVEERERE